MPVLLVRSHRVSVFLTIFGAVAASPQSHDTDGRDPSRDAYFGEPLVAVTQGDRKESFDEGFRLFTKTWNESEGLGPHFNANSCVTCHRNPVPGGGGTTRNTFVPHIPGLRDIAGGTTFAQFRLDKAGKKRRLDCSRVTVFRKSQPLFGIGLLEAVSDVELLRYAKENREHNDGVLGRLAKVRGKYGRFGWKGTIPTIDEFVAMALSVEMGLTTTRFPYDRSRTSVKRKNLPDVSDNQLHAISEFCRLLAAPGLPMQQRLADRGSKLFNEIGCNSCHRSSLPLENAKQQVFGVKEIHPYTDLLVHDMGIGLADGIAENDVSESEFRTPALWGAYSNAPYLHDGRAQTFRDAIIAHGGEAQSSTDRFKTLSRNDEEALFQFLKSL